MVSTVIYDNGPLPINISSEEQDLASYDWTAYLFRDEESYVAIPKDSFSVEDGVYSYTIPVETVRALAKGMYSIRIDLPDGPVVTANIISLKKHTELQ